MSLFDTPELPTRYGALDSDAFTDGMALHTHAERVMTMNANHLLAKGEHLFTLMVPRQEGDAVNSTDSHPYFNTWPDGIRSWAPTTHWTQITAPFPVPKKPGLNRAELRVMARISEGHTVYLQVATKGRPFHPANGPSSPNVITMVGDSDNDVDSYTKTGLWIDPGQYEEIRLYVKGLPTGDGASTAIGGEPNERSDEPSRNFGYALDYIDADADFATWESPGWSRSGAELTFFDADANTIARRIITSVFEVSDGGSGILRRGLKFAPPLTEAQLTQVKYGDDWAVLALPTIGLVGLTLAAEERTL